MRSIIQDGSDDMPPTVFEGAIHIIRGEKIMRNIIIVDPYSTGYNLVEDVIRRGYNPVVLETRQEKGVDEIWRAQTWCGFNCSELLMV